VAAVMDHSGWRSPIYTGGGDVHMLTSRAFKGAIVSILAVLLMLSVSVPVLLSPQPAAAQTDCGITGATIELKYDDGIPFGQMSDQLGGCDACSTYQGVEFSLPEGVSSSVMTKVRFYAGSGKTKGDVWIHIMDTDLNYLTPKLKYTITKEDWHEVVLPDVVVPNKFWVWVQRTTKKVMPFYDIKKTGQSWNGSDPTKLEREGYKRPAGDLMIRAYIVPEATVGKGKDYDYQSIQEAIDSVWDGWRIIVGDGTYQENVTVNKSVTIKSLSGPAKTTVQTSPPYPDNNVFTITASCVRLSGFTIQSATDTGRAGVSIKGASGCVVSGNVMVNNNYGIYVSENSTGNILLENECTLNTTGIYIDGSDNYISGNNLHANTAAIGSAVYLSSIASGNQLRFNTITVDPGTDPAAAASPQVYNQSSTEEVSAVENWWGTDSGPSNADGQGPAVGEMVDYAPWLAKQPVRVKTVAAQAGPFILDGRTETSTVVVKQGTGSAFVSVASFAENPAGEFRYKTPGKWIDVLSSSTQGIDEVEIRVYYTADEVAALKLKEGSLRLFWWNGEKWKVCSKTKVDKENDFVWAKLNLKTKPTPSDLTGTMFAVGIPKGGFAWWLIPLIIVFVIIALVAIRLFWVLVVGRGRYAVD
jgi:parallel beta-helix repeat protein